MAVVENQLILENVVILLLFSVKIVINLWHFYTNIPLILYSTLGV